MSLQDSLKSATVNAVIAELDKAISAAKQKVDAAQAELDEAIKVKETVRKALQPAERGMLFFLRSRTGESDGHFMEAFGVPKAAAYLRYTVGQFDNVTIKCSCPAGQYGNECWAVKTIKTNLRKTDGYGAFKNARPDFSYRYNGTEKQFDGRIPR